MPTPDPIPPTPPKPPTPTKIEKAWVLIIEESADRTPEFAKFMNDLSFFEDLKKRGHNWRVYDEDSEEAIKNGYNQIVLDRPGLILLNYNTKKVEYAGILLTKEEINARLR